MTLTTIEDFIRIRVMSQNLHLSQDSREYQNRMDILEKAWWIYSDYDIISRSQQFSRSPLKILQREGALKVIINGVNRVISRDLFVHLLPHYRKDVLDEELIEIIETNSGLDKSHLGTHIEGTNSQLTSRLRKEMQRWNVIKYNDGYYSSDQIILKSKTEKIDVQELLLRLFQSYPVLTLQQTSLLTGMSIHDLHIPMSKLIRKTQLYRGISRKKSPEEYFDLFSAIEDYKIEDVDWTIVPPFVLEKRDALVDIIRLEKGVNYGDAAYWLFVEGLPLAEFDLKRKPREATYIVAGFRKIIQFKYGINELIEYLKTWAESVRIKLEVNLMENPLAEYASSLVKFLVNRGYKMQNTNLVLVRSHDADNSNGTTLDWETIKEWYFPQQKFETSELYKIIDMLISVEDLNSLAIRLGRKISEVEMQDFVFTSGINNRLGYISYSNLDVVFSAYPKNPKLSELDQHLLEILSDKPATPKQLRSKLNMFEKKILSRLFYLESQRLVQRTQGDFVPPLFSYWKVMDYRVEDGYSRPEALMTIIHDLLKYHPPLTYTQLGRFLGLTTHDLENLFHIPLKKGKLIEGYFMPNQNEVQITLPTILDEIEQTGKEIHDLELETEMEGIVVAQELSDEEENEEEESYEEKLKRYLADITIIPQNDQIAQFYLPNFMLNTPNMTITRRLHTDTKFWMILWEGHIVGYIVQYPSDLNLIDYDFEIKIIKEMEKIPVLSGIIEQYTTIVHGWNNDQLRAVSINEASLDGRKFEPIRFLLTSMGVRIAGIDS